MKNKSFNVTVAQYEKIHKLSYGRKGHSAGMVLRLAIKKYDFSQGLKKIYPISNYKMYLSTYIEDEVFAQVVKTSKEWECTIPTVMRQIINDI